MVTGKKMVLIAVAIVLLSAVFSAAVVKAASFDAADRVQKLTMITTTPEYDSKRYEAAKMIADSWKKLGIEVEVKPLDFTVLNIGSRSVPYNFDAFFMAMSGRTERLDPDMFVRSSAHSSENVDKGNNRVGLMDPEFDRLSDAQKAEMDPEKRRQLVFKCQEILANQAVLFPLWYPMHLGAANKERFKGYVLIPGEVLYNEWTPVMVEPLTQDKVLKVVLQKDVDNLNVMAAISTWNWKILRLVYDKLVRIGPELVPVPASAEKWKVVEPTVIDVTLRKGLTFHDGKPLTVEDVKFSFDYLMKWKPPYLKAFVDPIKEVRILDESTVRFVLKNPSAPFVQNSLGTVPLLPKHIWEGMVEKNKLKSPDEWANPDLTASGPFKFIHWKKGEEVKLERFAGHYAPPKIDAMIQVTVGNTEAVLGALETKTGDMVAWDISSAHYDMAQKMPHLETFKVPDIGWTYMGVNTRRAPFSDLTFRKAIAHTIDYQLMVDLLLDGYGQPGGSGKVVSPAVKFFYNDKTPEFPFSVEKAREILKAAGYRWDNKGNLYYPAKK